MPRKIRAESAAAFYPGELILTQTFQLHQGGTEHIEDMTLISLTANKIAREPPNGFFRPSSIVLSPSYADLCALCGSVVKNSG